MKISFPWPSPMVFPNFKRANHWRVYRFAEKAEREAGYSITCAAIPARDRRAMREQLDGKLTMSVTFFPPDRRSRDDDGMVGAFKHLRDGMADALGIDDKHFRCVYAFADAEAPGRVEVKLLDCKSFENRSLALAQSAVNGLPPSGQGEVA